MLPFSGGNALIYGTSINSEGGLDRVRPLMGVCPQFDVLWGELSGAEHLTIAGHIKGLPWNKVRRRTETVREKDRVMWISWCLDLEETGGAGKGLA